MTFDPISVDEVKKILGGRYRQKMKTLMPLLEFLEDLYPTDDDCQDEFYLGMGDVEFRKKFPHITEDILQARIVDAVKIGMLVVTDPTYVPSAKPRGYIYNPEVGNVLEDIRTEIIQEIKKASAPFARADSLYTGRVFSPDFGETMGADEIKRILGKHYRYHSHRLLEIVEYIEKNLNDGWEFFMNAVRKAIPMTPDQFRRQVENGLKIGIFVRTDNGKPYGYFYNRKVKKIILDFASEEVKKYIPKPPCKGKYDYQIIRREAVDG